MKFKRIPSPFAAQGDEMWGAQVRNRYSFVITQEGGLYAASWKDALLPGRQAARFLVRDAPTFAAAEKACREQEQRLRPN